MAESKGHLDIVTLLGNVFEDAKSTDTHSVTSFETASSVKMNVSAENLTEEKISRTAQSFSVSEEQSANGVDCSICVEAFTACGDHEAKICPCGHTFCRSCLSGLSNPKLCPVCRMRITCEIDDLPRNYALIDLIMRSPAAVVPDRKKTLEELRKELAEREAEENRDRK